MTMDWPLIGAVGGLATTVAMVGIGTAVVLRSPAQEIAKSPSAPVLWSVRRPDAVPSATPGVQLWDVGPAPLVPAREPLVINDEVTASTNPVAPQVRPQRRPPPPVEPVIAKPALTPPPKKVALAYAPSAPQPAPPKPQLGPFAPKPQLSPFAPKPQLSPQVQVEPPKIIDRRYDGVLTMAEIARLRAGLRMTPEQVPLWGPVEAELRQIGRLQMAQINSGRKPEVPQSEFQKLYYAARPLLAVMRPDQKERVRALARTMGYGSVVSMI